MWEHMFIEMEDDLDVWNQDCLIIGALLSRSLVLFCKLITSRSALCWNRFVLFYFILGPPGLIARNYFEGAHYDDVSTIRGQAFVT